MNSGRLYDKCGNYERAFECYREGNDLKRAHYEPATVERDVTARLEVFRDGISQFPSSANESELPVFIIGMPRSGTSLVEQMLASHPEIHGAGELLEIGRVTKTFPDLSGQGRRWPRILEAADAATMTQIADRHLEMLRGLNPDAARITDKMPYNFYEVPLIRLLFPRARIIHCVRNAVDTCLSCYFQNFPASNGWPFDLKLIGFFYNQYRRIMRHWQETLGLPIMDVNYEELARDPEPSVRGMLEYCGMAWNEQCLRFHESDRVVNTASYRQVRRPVYTGSIERWRNYEQFLTPLLEELEADAD